MALGAVCAWSIDIPRIGFARDAQGRVVSINGIAGNFIAGDASAAGLTVSFSWNGSYGIRKTDSTIEWWDSSGATLATLDAPAGDAVIGFGVRSALIYSKSADALYEVKANQWRLQQVPVGLLSGDAEVLAVTGRPDSIDIAIRRPGGLFIASFDPSTGSRLAEAALTRPASAVLFLGAGAIAGAIAGIEGSTIWMARADGSEWSIDTGTPLTDLSWMGGEWLQLSSADRQYALRIRSGSDPALYTLPLAAPE